jgi:hypothetical protein
MTDAPTMDAAPRALPMLCSPSISQVATALAAAQGDFPTIPRDRTVKVNLKGRDGQPGGSYTFRYAPLETILAAVRKPLAANGLALLQAIVAEPTDTGFVEMMRTTLLHSSGEWFACDVPIFVGTGDNKSQAYASGVTYSRRYGVTMLLCVAADEDDDGNDGDQDNARPDFERQAPQREQYRGQFPKSGGNQQRKPERPQRTPAGVAVGGHAAQVSEAETSQDAGSNVHPATGELTSPWCEGLTPGQLSMLKMRSEVAGLSEADVLEKIGPVTPDNVSDALARLKVLAEQALS